MFKICWKSCHTPLTDQTTTTFEEHGVCDQRDQRIWAGRLALPILSKNEVIALLDEVEAAHVAVKRRKGLKPTPRRFAVWLMAHRLGLKADTVLRKAYGSESPAYFRKRKNPIKPSLPKAGGGSD